MQIGCLATALGQEIVPHVTLFEMEKNVDLLLLETCKLTDSHGFYSKKTVELIY